VDVSGANDLVVASGGRRPGEPRIHNPGWTDELTVCLWTPAGVSQGGGIIEAMAICLDCDREMRTAPSCVVSTLHLAGARFPLVPYGRDGTSAPGAGRCGDCGVEPGGFHHLGCDLQRCPRCQRQLLSCGCPFDELGGAEQDAEPGPLVDLAARDSELDEHGYRRCPRCGSSSVMPIFYGRSTPAVERLAAARQLELAGRSFGPDQPSSRCRDCEHAWSRQAG
jgi:hypothetical protein